MLLWTAAIFLALTDMILLLTLDKMDYDLIAAMFDFFDR